MTENPRAADLDWEDVRCFAVLARRRTLAAAARALGVTSAAVARRLSNLEITLGIPLFKRRARTYSLTAEGSATLAEAAQMEMAACSMLCRSRVIVRDTAAGARARGVSGVQARARRSSRPADREILSRSEGR